MSVVFINHLAAAVWYFVGDVYSADAAVGHRNWIEAYDIQSRPVLNRYIISYGWSVSNFGLGISDVYPQNSLEGVLSIGLLLIGMATFQ